MINAIAKINTILAALESQASVLERLAVDTPESFANIVSQQRCAISALQNGFSETATQLDHFIDLAVKN